MSEVEEEEKARQFSRCQKLMTREQYLENLHTFCRVMGFANLKQAFDAAFAGCDEPPEFNDDILWQDVITYLAGEKAKGEQFFLDDHDCACLFRESRYEKHVQKLINRSYEFNEYFNNCHDLRTDRHTFKFPPKGLQDNGLVFQRPFCVVWRIPHFSNSHWLLPLDSVYQRITARFTMHPSKRECLENNRARELLLHPRYVTNPDDAKSLEKVLHNFLYDPLTPRSATLAQLPFQLTKTVFRNWYPLRFRFHDALSGDAVERQHWRQVFHTLQHEEINRNEMKEVRKHRFKTTAWRILFPEDIPGLNCQQRCPYCGKLGTTERPFTRYQYLHGKPRNHIHQSHIVPACWNNCDDKWWWNCIPTCCNLKQPNKFAKGGSHDLVEHMLVSLVRCGDEGEQRMRTIVLAMLKYLLSDHRFSALLPPYIGTRSLQGFALGFYALLDDPDVCRWDCLLLTASEVNDLRTLLQKDPAYRSAEKIVDRMWSDDQTSIQTLERENREMREFADNLRTLSAEEVEEL